MLWQLKRPKKCSHVSLFLILKSLCRRLAAAAVSTHPDRSKTANRPKLAVTTYLYGFNFVILQEIVHYRTRQSLRGQDITRDTACILQKERRITMNKQDINLPIAHEDYNAILRQAVAAIEHARQEIAKHINGNVATAYWEIGKLLHERKIESGYGDSVVRQLSVDLKERYPKMGVSPRQLWNMKKFYERYNGHDEKVLRSVALLPWSHNLLILSKGLDDEATLYYARETVSKGWNRDLLLNAIKLQMYESHAVARVDNNFDKTLPAEQARYANEVFSSSYNLGFLGVTTPILELELEGRLVKAITRFLMELGNGFTFIGNQHVLEFNGKESKVDMLFFHRGLRCLVAVDCKI